jgi:hypothetical protein
MIFKFTEQRQYVIGYIIMIYVRIICNPVTFTWRPDMGGFD